MHDENLELFIWQVGQPCVMRMWSLCDESLSSSRVRGVLLAGNFGSISLVYDQDQWCHWKVLVLQFGCFGSRLMKSFS